GGLDGVHVEWDAGGAATRGMPGHGLYHADFIVHPHYAHHRDATVEGGGQRLFRHDARRVDREDDFLAAQPGDRVSGREDRLVLDRRHGDAERPAALARGERTSDHREVVRLGPTRRAEPQAG